MFLEALAVTMAVELCFSKSPFLRNRAIALH
jgi:hypothetical protein